MRPAETPSSPAFPVLDPFILDNDMDNPYQDNDMEFLNPAALQASSSGAGQDFDDIFSQTSAPRAAGDANPYLSPPSDLSKKRPYPDEEDMMSQPHPSESDSGSDSPDNSSRSSSSESPRNHRESSVASTSSGVHSENATMTAGYPSNGWLNADYMQMKDEPLFGLDTDLPLLDGTFAMDTDLESSNKAMDSAFDFESAASSPSPLKTEAAAPPKSQKLSKTQLRSPSNHAKTQFTQTKTASRVSPYVPFFGDPYLYNCLASNFRLPILL